MNTQIISRGYNVIIPTMAVAAFLSLSHDDQVELADELAAFNMSFDAHDFDDVDPVEDTGSVTDLLIESMAVELGHQDQAIDTFMDERNELNAELARIRFERDSAIDGVNQLFAESNNLNDILLKSSLYVGRTRELLTQLGIEVETDANGLPNLKIDVTRLDAATDVLWGLYIADAA